MKITWLGQAGLLFDDGKMKIMIDPYLSDSVEKVEPKNYRRVAVKKEFFDIEPDIMIFTHNHLDHYDPETAEIFLAEDRSPATVLCPCSVWERARQLGKNHLYIELDRGSEWTEGDFRFRAVMAAHSDPFAIGVIIEHLPEGVTYYVTGDTLYNGEILKELPERIDVIFLPINGVGNNMNPTDAERFFKACGARVAVPLHVGMFDEKAPDAFSAEPRALPEIYEQINLEKWI